MNKVASTVFCKKRTTVLKNCTFRWDNKCDDPSPKKKIDVICSAGVPQIVYNQSISMDSLMAWMHWTLI